MARQATRVRVMRRRVGRGKQSKRRIRIRRSSIQHKGKRKRARAIGRMPSFDFESMLVSGALSGSAYKVNGNALLVPEFLHNITPATKRISYNAGYSVGRQLYAKSMSNTIDPLIKVFENSGTADVFYYPFGDSALFTMKRKTGVGRKTNLNIKLHRYAAGIIAGYLTASTGIATEVTETKCVYDGSETCQFVATPKRGGENYKQGGADLKPMLSVIGDALEEGAGSTVSEDYYVMNMLPFMNSNLASSIAKVMYLFGEKLARRSSRPDPEKVASYIGVSAKRNDTKNGTVVTVSYDPLNSAENFVSITSSFMLGYIKSAYNVIPKSVREVEGGRYKIKLIIPRAWAGRYRMLKS